MFRRLWTETAPFDFHGAWNIPGGDIEDAVRRMALLDRYCAEIGRDPGLGHPLDANGTFRHGTSLITCPPRVGGTPGRAAGPKPPS